MPVKTTSDEWSLSGVRYEYITTLTLKRGFLLTQTASYDQLTNLDLAIPFSLLKKNGKTHDTT